MDLSAVLNDIDGGRDLTQEEKDKLAQLKEEYGRPPTEVRIISLTTGEATDEVVSEENVTQRCLKAREDKENILLQFKCFEPARCPVPGEWHDLFLIFDGRVFLNETEAREQIKRAMKSRIIALGMGGLSDDEDNGSSGMPF